MRKLNEYVINPKTMFIQPSFDEYGNLSSIVWELYEKFHVAKKPTEVVDDSIKYYGYNLNGAIAGSKSILGNYKMIPVTICTSLDLYWFPSASITNPDCFWSTYRYIEKLTELNNKETKINFTNGQSIIVEISRTRLDHKTLRAEQLRNKMKERIKGSVPHRFIIRGQTPAALKR